MKIRSLGHVVAGSILAIVAISAGCQEKKAVTTPPVTQPASLSPEESFQAVVESFREGIGVKIGFTVPDGTGGHSRMTGSNDVSSELIPPTDEGGQYKGIITVRRESEYSLKRSTEPTQEEEVETEQEGEGEFGEDGTETEIINPLIVNTPDPNRSAGSKLGDSEVLIHSEENFIERKYELVYEQGKWKLTTKLDPKTETSIQAAFDRALDAQSDT
jgi:hypothetical protein